MTPCRSDSSENDPAKPAIGYLPILVGVAVFAVVLAARSRVLEDPDVYLHVTVGRWMISHEGIPHRDIFSWSMVGAPWVPHEWLAEIAMACMYDALGWAGLVILCALCFGTAMALLLRMLMRHLTPTAALGGTALAAGLALPHLFARPHMFGLPLLVLWVSILVQAREHRCAPSPYIALVTVLWANLHGGYIIGNALVILLGAEAVFEASDWRVALHVFRDWGIVIAMSCLAAFATPNLIDGVLLPFHLMRMDFAMSFIGEWQSANFQVGQPLEFWLLLVLLGTLSVGIRLPLTRLGMVLLFLHMALQHQRNSELLGLTAPILLAPSLAPQLRRYGGGSLDQLITRINRPVSTGVMVLASLLLIATSAVTVHFGIANDVRRYTPAEAIQFILARNIKGRVFNDINFGDYLIFSGIAPFIDGRIDMYGDGIIKHYAAIGEFPEFAVRSAVTWAIFSPRNPHVALLDNLTGWRRIYADDVAIVYVYETPKAAL